MYQDLSLRLITFSSEIIKFSRSFGKELYQQNIKNQLIKSSTSVGANYQESQFAISKPDFINKLHISLKELAETIYWLKTLEKSGLIAESQNDKLIELLKETEELRKILTSSIITAKNNLEK